MNDQGSFVGVGRFGRLARRTRCVRLVSLLCALFEEGPFSWFVIKSASVRLAIDYESSCARGKDG